MIGNTIRLEQAVHGPNRGTSCSFPSHVLFLVMFFSYQIVECVERSVD